MQMEFGSSLMKCIKPVAPPEEPLFKWWCVMKKNEEFKFSKDCVEQIRDDYAFTIEDFDVLSRPRESQCLLHKEDKLTIFTSPSLQSIITEQYVCISFDELVANVEPQIAVVNHGVRGRLCTSILEILNALSPEDNLLSDDTYNSIIEPHFMFAIDDLDRKVNLFGVNASMKKKQLVEVANRTKGHLGLTTSLIGAIEEFAKKKINGFRLKSKLELIKGTLDERASQAELETAKIDILIDRNTKVLFLLTGLSTLITWMRLSVVARKAPASVETITTVLCFVSWFLVLWRGCTAFRF